MTEAKYCLLIIDTQEGYNSQSQIDSSKNISRFLEEIIDYDIPTCFVNIVNGESGLSVLEHYSQDVKQRYKEKVGLVLDEKVNGNSAFFNQDIYGKINSINISDIIICGTDLIYVGVAAGDAHQRGFKNIFILEDLVSSKKGDEEFHKMYLNKLNEYFGKVIKSSDALEMFK